MTEQVRILLPCGIGDVYWALVKFRAFCRKHGIKLPPKVAIITTTPEARYAGSEFRSIEFLKMVPFVEVDDPPNQEAYPTKPAPKWLMKAYQEMWHGSCTHKESFLGYDHFLVYNCAITNGVFLEEIDDLECEWDFPMEVSHEQSRFQDECRRLYGSYVVFLWSFCGGGYSERHVKEFSPKKITEATIRFVNESGCTPVFVGSWWDVKHGNDHLREIIASVPGAVDLVGKTSIDQLFGAIKGSEMVVGCHCGPTIMAAAFRKKTIMMWAKSYPLFAKDSPLVVAPPETRETTYWPIYTRGLTADEFSGRMLELYRQEPVKCVCGEASSDKYEHPCYEVDQRGRLAEVEGQFGRCSCGVVRQTSLPFADRAGYEEYYRSYPPTTSQYEEKDWEHDFALANGRCDKYRISRRNPQRILDVGSGSGAFVHACRQRQQEAYGCEIAEYSYARSGDFIYRKPLCKVNFPTDHFDLVTCHDVLEHEMDPKGMIGEMFRITAQEGRCIVDFPNYFSEAGRHHWKSGEHIWYFTAEQLEAMIRASGFVVEELHKPIESKLVLYCRKPEQERPKILVPPGIGDSYWSIVKLQAFLRREGLGLPDVSILYRRIKDSEGHKRSFPFLEMFPFLHSTGMAVEGRRPGGSPIWKEAYLEQGRTIFSKVYGFDYFISYNGHLRAGKDLRDIDPDLPCSWRPPMFVSLEQERCRSEAVRKYGDYIVFYFVFRGSYAYWSRQFPVESVISFVNRLSADSGMRPVLVGAAWDASDRNLQEVRKGVRNAVDLLGKTSIEQVFGVIRGAKAVVGYPSGLTIMSAVLGQKTLIIWNDYYNKDFVRNSCPPDAWERNYWAENTRDLTPDYLAAWSMEKIAGKRCTVPRKQGDEAETVAQQDMPAESAPKGKYPKSTGVTIACVLKSGGDYDVRYAETLYRMVSRNVTKDFRFVCLTDLPKVGDLDVIRLSNGLPGWWAKMELFRPDLFDTERVLYFDLDTIIMGNINDMLELDGTFYGLRPWNRANREKGRTASGVMAWMNGSCSFIYDEFKERYLEQIVSDQTYITNKLGSHGIQWKALQDFIPGIRSYKRECKNGLPNGTRIVCFHGRPRPHECMDKWVREAWR